MSFNNKILLKYNWIIWLLLFCFAGCRSFYALYDGYYMYDKDKYRRFTDSKEESIKRGVFVRDLNYQIDIPVVKNVYIEKGFRWGSSSAKTIVLTPTDTFSNNEPNKPYNVIVECLNNYNGYKVERSVYKIHEENATLKDTILINIFLIDTVALHNKQDYIKGKFVLKVW